MGAKIEFKVGDTTVVMAGELDHVNRLMSDLRHAGHLCVVSCEASPKPVKKAPKQSAE